MKRNQTKPTSYTPQMIAREAFEAAFASPMLLSVLAKLKALPPVPGAMRVK
jgi:hypothetical protein